MSIVNTLSRLLGAIGLLASIPVIAWAADSGDAKLEKLLSAEANLKEGKSVEAYRVYVELADTVSKDSPLKVVAWRGVFLSSPNGDELERMLRRFLKNESGDVKRKTLSVFRGLRRTDDRLDDLLLESIGGSDPAVGVMLVELLSARGAVDILPRLAERFYDYEDQVKGAIIEVFSTGSGSHDSGFLEKLVFESEKWSELASESWVAMNDPSVDDYLLQFCLKNHHASLDNQTLAIELLRKRGAVAFKDDFYRMIVGSEASVRSAITHALRDWGEASDLETILKVMTQSDERALRTALSRLFVSLAQTVVKDDSFALAALNEALLTADAPLNTMLLKMKEAIGRDSN